MGTSQSLVNFGWFPLYLVAVNIQTSFFQASFA